MKIYKVTYLLNPRKALSFKTENSVALPDWLLEKIEAQSGCDCIVRLETSYNVLSIIICSKSEITPEGMQSLVDSISEGADTGKINFTIAPISADQALSHPALGEEEKHKLSSFTGAAETKKNPSFSDRENKKTAEAYNSAPEVGTEDPFDKISKLIGADELKAWAKEMKKLHENLPADAIRPLMSMTYLISVNEGNGSSTAFQSVGDVVAKLTGKKEAVLHEYTAEPDAEAKEQYNIDRIIKDASRSSASESTLHIFSVWIDKFQNNKYAGEWLKLLSAFRQSRNAVYIFAVPYIEKIALRDMHNRIEDILPNRVMTVTPLTNDDYMKLFENYFEKCNMKLPENLHPLLSQVLAEEKSDGRFYGINTVDKICDEICYTKMMNRISNPDSDSSTVFKEDIIPLLHQPENADGDALSAMQKLEAMISLDEVKARIKEIIATSKMQKKLNDGKANSMHMMFSGAPGTGKTVVARLLGEILRENKLLSCGGFYEVTRKDLVGSYVGHTAPKTAEVCKLAYGSVLFIDEAYLLDGGSEKDFGKEAIGTLIAEMENKRGDMVVIFAGYEKELERLFELNPGLRDRIPYRIHFENYDRDELLQIFHKMLPSKFSYDSAFDEAVKCFFDNLPDSVMNNPNFSNGRFVRNLIERMVSKAALRMEMEGLSSELKITAEDFNASVSDGEFASLNDVKKASRIGF